MRAKKILLFALAIVISCMLFACAGDDPEPVDGENAEQGLAPAAEEEPEAETADIDDTYDTEIKRIYIEDNEFRVNGNRIWINGANTPWHRWNDFGGNYDDFWWDEHFKELHENGLNATRVWINCNNDQRAVIIDEDGFVSGVSDGHWYDLDEFFKTAERNNIYIMATLLSFDHFKSSQAQRWRNMLMSAETIDSFVTHYVIPFVERYKHNPFLWSIDLMNEPDWVHEQDDCGQIAWEHISHLFARAAAAIRENSDVLVTVGMAFPKYNADGSGYEGNKVSDAFLQSLYPNPNARLDFWSPHYYDWVGQWYGVPFTSTPSGSRANGGWGLCDSKPALIAETTARGSAGHTLIEDYENAYLNGWHGVMAWTSNGVDANGGLNELIPAISYMLEKYRDIIFPWENNR